MTPNAILVSTLSAIAFATINFLLVRTLSPVRVGLLARLIKRGNTMLLQLAIESLHRETIRGPIRIYVEVDQPGGLMIDEGIGFFAGPDVGPGVLRAQVSGRGLILEIERMRGLKTWTFEIECTADSRRVHGELTIPRRPLKHLFPVSSQKAEAVETLSSEPAVIRWSIAGDEGHDSRKEDPWQPIQYEPLYTLALLLAGGISAYFAVASFSETLFAAAHEDHILTDLLLVGGFIVVITTLSLINRSSWSSVAQGYLERRSLAVENLPAPVNTAGVGSPTTRGSSGRRPAW